MKTEKDRDLKLAREDSKAMRTFLFVLAAACLLVALIVATALTTVSWWASAGVLASFLLGCMFGTFAWYINDLQIVITENEG